MKFILALLTMVASYCSAAPQLIAHRAGTADAPENTLPAIRLALENGADAIWVTVQLSKDGVPVLYRPADLSALSAQRGPVSGFSAAQLASVDVGETFTADSQSWRGKDATIPTLDRVLREWPETFFYLDIKSPDADPQMMASRLLDVLEQTHSLKRVRVYSTEDKYLQALAPSIPRFVTRSETRTRLADISLSHHCQAPATAQTDYWYGLELNRKVTLVEKFTLGEGASPATLTWDKEAMDCFRSQGNAHILFFGVNSPGDYRRAIMLGADGVMVDSPRQFADRAR